MCTVILSVLRPYGCIFKVLCGHFRCLTAQVLIHLCYIEEKWPADNLRARLLCFTEARKPYDMKTFGATWQWVNNDIIFISGWTLSLIILHIWCHLSLLRPKLCSHETLQLCIISWCPPQAEGQRMALTEQRVGIAATGSAAHVTKTSGRGTKRIFSLSNGSKPWYNSSLQLLTWCCFSCTPLLFSLGGNGAFRQSCNPIRPDLYWPWSADISFLFSPFLSSAPFFHVARVSAKVWRAYWSHPFKCCHKFHPHYEERPGLPPSPHHSCQTLRLPS